MPSRPVTVSPRWGEALDADEKEIARAYARLVKGNRSEAELRLLNAGLASMTLSRIGERQRLGTFSRLARIHAGLTQAELGDVLGCSRILVARVETGAKPMRDDRLASDWASACNVPRGIVLLDSIPR